MVQQLKRMRDKTADLKRNKTVDFQNETKQWIFKNENKAPDFWMVSVHLELISTCFPL